MTIKPTALSARNAVEQLNLLVNTKPEFAAWRHDVAEYERCIHGPLFEAAPNDATFWDIARGSGYLGMRFAIERPASRVIMCVTDTAIAESVRAFLEAIDLRNVTLCGTSDEILQLFSSTAAERDIVRIREVEEISDLCFLEGRRIAYLFGRYSGCTVDALAIHRLSKRVSTTFCWLSYEHELLYGGTPGPEIEVSIVVPIYNVEAFLDQCVESLSSQSLLSREIILVDDGSSDRSPDICDAWARRDATIRVIRKPNGGCASARARGLEEARGAYVMFVDSDDWIEPESLERLYRGAVVHAADVVQGGWRRVFADGSVADETNNEVLACTQDLSGTLRLPREVAITLQPTIWRRLYRSAFLKGNGIDFQQQFRRFDDLPFQFHALSLAREIIQVPDLIYNYRIGRDGQDVSADDERLFIHFDIFDYMKELSLTLGGREHFLNFVKVQVATHTWAISKLRPEFRQEYRKRAARDLFGPESPGSLLARISRVLRVSRGRKRIALRLLWIYLRSGRRPRS
jgi:glycosyltransferase involved in cell wall biosynthesis